MPEEKLEELCYCPGGEKVIGDCPRAKEFLKKYGTLLPKEYCQDYCHYKFRRDFTEEDRSEYALIARMALASKAASNSATN